MQTEARVGERALSSVHGGGGLAAVDVGPRKYSTYSQPRNHHHQRHQQPPQIGSISHLLAGGVAGAVSKTCTAPLARLTILFQIEQGRANNVSTSGEITLFLLCCCCFLLLSLAALAATAVARHQAAAMVASSSSDSLQHCHQEDIGAKMEESDKDRSQLWPARRDRGQEGGRRSNLSSREQIEPTSDRHEEIELRRSEME